MILLTVAAGGVFVGWFLHVVVSHERPADFFDVLDDVPEPPSHVTVWLEALR